MDITAIEIIRASCFKKKRHDGMSSESISIAIPGESVNESKWFDSSLNTRSRRRCHEETELKYALAMPSF